MGFRSYNNNARNTLEDNGYKAEVKALAI
jgi:hypothetical protein